MVSRVQGLVSMGSRVAVAFATQLVGQDRALGNARRASTELSRNRVERDEVEIFLESHRAEDAADATGAADADGWDAARAAD